MDCGIRQQQRMTDRSIAPIVDNVMNTRVLHRYTHLLNRYSRPTHTITTTSAGGEEEVVVQSIAY